MNETLIVHGGSIFPTTSALLLKSTKPLNAPIAMAFDRSEPDGGTAAAKDAVKRAQTMPSLRVGLHLVLVDGKPILPPGAVPDLIGMSAAFPNGYGGAGAAMFFLPKVRRQLAAEIEAQFMAFEATGLKLDHVNAHKHFHLHPTIASLIVKPGKKHGVRGARVPLEPQAVLARIEKRKASGVVALTTPFARLLRNRFRRAGLPPLIRSSVWLGQGR